MGKQYIATGNAPQAHKSDILGVEITARYTITASSDGYANYWDNQLRENQSPNDTVNRQFINKTGIHHISSYENILPDSTVKVVLVALVCFDGSITFQYFINDDISTIKVVEGHPFKSHCWAPGFHKDPESKQDYFLITQATGATLVNHLNIVAKDEDVTISFEKVGEMTPKKSVFPNSLAVSPATDKKVAIGYVNGDVYLYDLILFKALYTFQSTELQLTNKPGKSSAIPRVLKFSPGGKLLAVARDSQSSGALTLYDVQYGENVGNLAMPSHSTSTSIGGFAHNGWIMGLSFDSTGETLASCGFDRCVRIWNVETREREATIGLSITDLEDTEHDEMMDKSIASGLAFIKPGLRAGPGGDNNEGLCVVSFDRGVRWFREAGGV
ncbi:WD40-repeat-containing domain protein [Scheffersomyces xylosifermentans]|uniref:WD40-repeat-containing domain protein n=1 Tax=Scheffersomyces xylosifermentans TaxID=1304137 RepID=UPI00315CF87D